MSRHLRNFIQNVLCATSLIVALIACSPTAVSTSEVVVQPPVPTPTLEPTFTPMPASTHTPIPSPTPTPEPTPTSLPQARLSGRILDQASGQPIAAAEVSAGAVTSATDADGHYALTDLPPGQYILSATHDDYDPGLSAILTLAVGEELEVDLTLYTPDTSPYPQDPMLTNPLDPNGASTKADAERLAREQGLTGEVVSIEETKLRGEFLVNYKIGDDVRAAVAELNHEVWELIDDTGRTWWIIKVCGNLASPLPQEAPIATPVPRPLPPLAEVLVDGLVVRTCASEECAEVGMVPRSVQVEVFGCLAEGGDWCDVGWAGGRGWCTRQSLRHLAVAEAVPVVEAVLPTTVSEVVTDGQEKIVFSSHYKENPEIYIINPDGSGLTRLTNSKLHELQVAWSPNGKQIAFVGSSNLNFDIYVMNIDGSNLKRLTDNPGQDWNLIWSPDDKKIAFESLRDGNLNYHIYIMDIDGSGLIRLTDGVGPDTHPTWSPDSQQIAFEYSDDIYMANTDGSGLTRLTNNDLVDHTPTWSPDGQHIAFSAYHGDSNDEIYVMNANGSNLRRLTDHSAFDTSPVWSPDSQRITFLSDRDGNREIYVINVDGSDLRRLTEISETIMSNLFWSPDGQQAAFIADWYIYMINTDGSNPRRLTDYYVSWAFLDWLP